MGVNAAIGGADQYPDRQKNGEARRADDGDAKSMTNLMGEMKKISAVNEQIMQGRSRISRHQEDHQGSERREEPGYRET